MSRAPFLFLLEAGFLRRRTVGFLRLHAVLPVSGLLAASPEIKWPKVIRKPWRLFLGVYFGSVLVLALPAQQPTPARESSESVELGAVTLRLGMAQDFVLRVLQESYNLQEIGAASAAGSSWMVETKSGPPSIAIASVTFAGGALSSVYKYWTAGSEPGTDAGIAGTLFGAVTKFEQGNIAPCQVTTNSSQQPAGQLRRVLVTCNGRQKYLSIDIVPMNDGKERVSLAEVLKYPSEEIEISQEPPAAGASDVITPASSSPAETAAVPVEKPGGQKSALLRSPRTKSDGWYPQDVDDVVPEVAPGTACPMNEVLSKAAKRVQELVDNVNKFTATEVVEHRNADKTGQLRAVETRKFDYLVSIAQESNGFLNVEEYRNGGSAPDQFPDHIATVGTPSLVLIFHPRNVKNFTMQCEGLGRWQDKPAWQVRFEERADSRHRMSVVVLNGGAFGLRLRGRAWILADSFQVARLETDLAEEVPQIRLRLQHEDIEYRPVRFKRGGEMWLPATTEFYMDFRNHRFYRRHRFTDFQLFSVQMQQAVGDPKE